MLKYRDNHFDIDVWSTTVDSLCITIKTDGVFDEYAAKGLSWKDAMAEYVSDLTTLMCDKFFREDKLEIEITASRIAYRVVEEKRFNKKYDPNSPINDFISDYNSCVKTHESNGLWFWEEVMRKYGEY